MEKTRPFVDCIPGIISHDIYSNDSKYVPEDIYSLGIEIIFKDQSALDLFMKHPKHYEANAIFEKYLADPPYMVLTHEVQSPQIEEIGTSCWFKFGVTNLKSSQSFYSKIFNWQFKNEDEVYIIMNNNTPIGHMYESKGKISAESGTVIYIAVKNIDETIDQAKQLGVTVFKEKTPISCDQGFYAHLKDVDGNILGIWSL